ncbi:adenylosuccinate lyase [Ammonifex thiophilus]|uniref:Adenylosuccinate lyase n=1 Tax=Ammonifex thiophilus TaxID=444093 RepID=A0A3D8P673_9THEO|nr:adenylosuccinate lyase [Ammonifex thiophilus]RDV84826.1 adenylosuccinate lyase [Ammonifex thiophilus]
MIPRYTLPEMQSLWSEENKFRKWLDVELAVCEAWAELGVIPREDLEEIKARANFDVERIRAIEKEVRHDVIAFITCVAEYVGEKARWIHLGLTSSDVVDTALSLLMKEAGEHLLNRLFTLREAVLEQAKRHRDTLMIGRTHGVHAEPITLGFKFLVWVAELDRQAERLSRAIETVSVGKISGAVGTYANLHPRVEELACRRLGLRPARVSTQILQRDRHAEYLTTLALIGGSLEKFAVEIRGLQRTEIRELEEPFRPGQKGSSAMPHKRNPIVAERISGLARILRGNALAAMENMALWHERDISHSSVERIIIPGSTTLLDYMLYKMTELVRDLHVYPQNMQRNLEHTRGLVFSQRVLLKLVEKGLSREEAYRLVQRNAMAAWEKGVSFKELLLQDEEIGRYLRPEEIEELFDYRYFLRHLDEIYQRFGL